MRNGTAVRAMALAALASWPTTALAQAEARDVGAELDRIAALEDPMLTLDGLERAFPQYAALEADRQHALRILRGLDLDPGARVMSQAGALMMAVGIGGSIATGVPLAINVGGGGGNKPPALWAGFGAALTLFVVGVVVLIVGASRLFSHPQRDEFGRRRHALADALRF